MAKYANAIIIRIMYEDNGNLFKVSDISSLQSLVLQNFPLVSREVITPLNIVPRKVKKVPFLTMS
jgi:hypothetical protein